MSHAISDLLHQNGASMAAGRKRPRKNSPSSFYYETYPSYETLFRLRFDEAKRAALSGREVIPKLVYTLVGPNIIRGIALAIDPFWKFRVGATRVSPTTRTRKRTINSLLSDRKLHKGRQLYSTTDGIYTIGSQYHQLCSGYSSTFDLSYLFDSTEVRPKGVPSFYQETKDSTGRERTPMGSRHNEFSSQKIVSFDSPPRRTRFGSTQTSVAFIPACGASEKLYSVDMRHCEDEGDAATLSESTIQAIFATEKSILEAEMPDMALKLMPKALPDRREYTLYRNLVELRDLPRGIQTLRNTMGDLVDVYKKLPPGLAEKVFSLTTPLRNIPAEYVSYNFGWKQLYRDLTGLLPSVSKITRKVNYLIKRKLKPTTFRSSSKRTLDGSGGPSFDYNIHDGENFWEAGAASQSTSVDRQAEFRVSLNAIFDFPTLSVPEFQREEFVRRFGLNPRPVDTYNLIPWTWLVDWFTGLGNYIEAIDAINSDRSVINFGFITGVLTSRYRCSFKSKSTVVDGWVYSPPVGTPGAQHTTVTVNRHTSILEVKTQIRKELSSAYDVVPVLAGGNLTPYQQSILGALIAIRSKALR